MSSINLNQYLQDYENISFSKLRGMDLRELLYIVEHILIEYREQLGLPNSVTFGIEIEFNRLSYSNANDKIRKLHVNSEWKAKSDGTVDGEIVSPILKDSNKTWQELALICKMLKEGNAIADKRSASHIHIGCNTLGDNKESWLNLLTIWMLYEKIILRFFYGERIGYDKNTVSRLDLSYPSIYEISKNLSEMIKALKNADIENILDIKRIIQSGNRTDSINFNNIKSFDEIYKNTIEIRCPLGTLEEIIWQNNINFSTKLSLTSRENRLNEDIIAARLATLNSEFNDYYLYREVFLDEVLELVDLVFQNPLDKLYFLKQYLKDFQYDDNPIKRFIR